MKCSENNCENETISNVNEEYWKIEYKTCSNHFKIEEWF